MRSPAAGPARALRHQPHRPLADDHHQDAPCGGAGGPRPSDHAVPDDGHQHRCARGAVAMTTSLYLATADRMLTSVIRGARGAWPRACAWLLRHELEAAMDRYGARVCPGIGRTGCSDRSCCCSPTTRAPTSGAGPATCGGHCPASATATTNSASRPGLAEVASRSSKADRFCLEGSPVDSGDPKHAADLACADSARRHAEKHRSHHERSR
jgi:hypothetical protein